MSNEKRQIVCILLIFVWVMIASRWLGIMQPQPAKKAAPAALQKDGKNPEAKDALAKRADPVNGVKPAEDPKTAAGESGKDVASGQAKGPSVAIVDPNELVLGSATDKSPDGYRLEVRLEQKGAGVETILSSRYEAEFEGARNPHLPLAMLRRDPTARPSLSFTLSPESRRQVDQPAGPEATGGEAAPGADMHAGGGEDDLDSVPWEVVLHDGKAVRTINSEDPETHKPIEGQEVAFRKRAESGVQVTKIFRLWQSTNGLELEIQFDSPDKERSFTYNLLGPHGIPIEGEWYTGTFREVFFGTNDAGMIKVASHTASDIVNAHEKPYDSTALPLRFAGVENQYFAAFLAPYPAPLSDQDRIDRETTAVLLRKDDAAPQMSDVSVRLTSKPIEVGPNVSQTHTYRIFAGPKTEEALAPYNAVTLASYRKGWIPGATFVARYFIAPTLSFTYNATQSIARLFGGTRGNWGLAIILLTMLVKLVMFPLGRKQALMAQRTQQLQPLMKQIQEKYKDDKEKQTRETLALYKKHGVNPVSGCIPALIQLPIFVGLWQALNSSAALRHAPFLWISDLSAPDMLFRFPMEVPFLGKWFNLLPLLVVGLMLFQTKLFAPPATTPEAEMQQKTMKYMMIFMAVMFYKVPSGLGIYFITSSLWSIGERLLLPKITHAEDAPQPETAADSKEAGGRARLVPTARGAAGNGGAEKKPAGVFSQFMERILEEARKDPTYRKVVEEREGKGNSGERKSGGKPRTRPGRN